MKRYNDWRDKHYKVIIEFVKNIYKFIFFEFIMKYLEINAIILIN